MSMLNKASRKLTEVVIGYKQYLFWGEELVAYADPEKKCYFLECVTMRNKTVMEFIKNGYRYKHSAYTIEECFNINNVI